jgi:hypothetical protein
VLHEGTALRPALQIRPCPARPDDGTWQRECTVTDVSDGGAKLTVSDSIEGLPLREFFLVLSSTGLAYRRCKLAWVNGDEIGVTFVRRKPAKQQ